MVCASETSHSTEKFVTIRRQPHELSAKFIYYYCLHPAVVIIHLKYSWILIAIRITIKVKWSHALHTPKIHQNSSTFLNYPANRQTNKGKNTIFRDRDSNQLPDVVANYKDIHFYQTRHAGIIYIYPESTPSFEGIVLNSMLGCHGTQFPISRMLYVLCVCFFVAVRLLWVTATAWYMPSSPVHVPFLFLLLYSWTKQSVGGRPPRYAPAPPPSMGAEAEQTAAPADDNLTVGSHGQYVPTYAYRCSYMTR